MAITSFQFTKIGNSDQHVLEMAGRPIAIGKGIHMLWSRGDSQIHKVLCVKVWKNELRGYTGLPVCNRG